LTYNHNAMRRFNRSFAKYLLPWRLSASAAFIKLGNAESRVKTGQDLIGDTQNLVLSPVVIAMWKPMAEAIGWGKKPVGWSEILALAKDPRGWASVGKPQWGPFRFGHTHPESSNSGLISLMAEVYAGAQKVRGLTLDNLARPEVGNYLGGSSSRLSIMAARLDSLAISLLGMVPAISQRRFFTRASSSSPTQRIPCSLWLLSILKKARSGVIIPLALFRGLGSRQSDRKARSYTSIIF
jgi:hypothetical protein